MNLLLSLVIHTAKYHCCCRLYNTQPRIIAAVFCAFIWLLLGRRRRTQSAAEPVEDEQPALDLDDVMYGTDDVVAGEAEDTLLGDDDEVEAPEAPDFGEFRVLGFRCRV